VPPVLRQIVLEQVQVHSYFLVSSGVLVDEWSIPS
jgi:hypothetical protein